MVDWLVGGRLVDWLFCLFICFVLIFSEWFGLIAHLGDWLDNQDEASEAASQKAPGAVAADIGMD